MSRFRRSMKRVPGAVWIYHKLLAIRESAHLRGRSPDQVFQEIFRGNRWGGAESVSGPGSDRAQTYVIESELARLVRDLDVETMLDIPCGDFNWMKHVDLGDIQYVGADIVEEIVRSNQMLHSNERRSFQRLNLLDAEIEAYDLIFCRDCLVHLSNFDVHVALKSIARSGSEFLLTTTFPGRVGNGSIATGQWRPLNLEAPPFSMPAPMLLINEKCTEAKGKYSDKSLGLWRITDFAGLYR